MPLTAKLLRHLLIGVPDDVLVVMPGNDHNYLRTIGQLTDAVRVPNSATIEEYHGDEHMPDDGKRIKVFLIS